jgi:hypothetical protein
MGDFVDLRPAVVVEPGESKPMNSVDYLRSVYRNPLEPTPVRMKAAIEAAPYEAPRLSMTASLDHVGFGDRLEEAIARLRAREPKLIDGTAVKPASESSDG